ncbi:MAG: IS66 family transposase zinc-finger binding domain-containing protein, partial [Chloroflexi bacterium]|nr:IS66 family transposase zinc-finger binding domain-containing protein [Chloroflexota bacterium]
MVTDGNLSSASPANELAQLQQEVQNLHTSLHQSSQQNELLRAERQQLLEEQQRSTRTIEQLQHQLQKMLQRMFGRSSEKIDPRQMLLFETLLEELAPKTNADEGADDDADTNGASSSTPRRKGHGRRKLPADLPREKILHDLPEAEKPCPCCGKMRHIIGQEVSEQLEFIPARLKVIEHTRLKYACRHCEQQS